MTYVFGITEFGTPLYLSRHKTWKAAEAAAKVHLETKPTATTGGVLIHDAEGYQDALDIAKIRIWAEFHRWAGRLMPSNA